MKHLVACGFAAVLIANGPPPASERDAEGDTGTGASVRETSPFIGRYNGNSFETAMGMEVLADGTWGWGVSVGALDLRARGTWEEKDGFLHLTSTPKPVAPQFTWSGLESNGSPPEETPFVRMVWAHSGERMQRADIRLLCANGKTFGGHVRLDGYPSANAHDFDEPLPADRDPRQSCDTPAKVAFKLHGYDIRSERFDLAKLGWEPGMTVRFAFERNDLGVADFTGVTGYLEGGILKLVGAEWPLELRKMPPPGTNVTDG